MLQNAVFPIEDLCKVQLAVEIEWIKSGSNVTYNQYIEFLMSSSAAYDKSQKPTRHKRVVYEPELYDKDVHQDIEDGYDINVPVHVNQANAHDIEAWLTLANSGWVSMPHLCWKVLGSKAKQMWDMLGNEDKAAILGLSDCNSLPNSDPQCWVNFHEHADHDKMQVQSH